MTQALGVFANYVAAGLMTGGLYALVAIGLTLIYSVMKVVNVAHGDLLTIGGYLLVILSGSAEVISPVLVVPFLLASLVVGAAIGVLVERTLVAPVVRSRREVEQRVLVLTLGLSILLANLMQVVFGPNVRQVPFLVQGATRLGSLEVANQRLATFALSVVLVGLLFIFLRFTRLGLAVRCTADNPEGAQACGISIRFVFSTVFAVATALAVAVGMFIAPITAVYPPMGFPFTIKAFIVVIVGGLGSLSGALAASYLLGIAEALAILWFPSSVANLIGPLLMLAVLLWRPSGLLGRQVGRI